MPGPFPGMDPYLEKPIRFPDLHHSFIIYTRAAIRAALPPGYLAFVEERVYIVPAGRAIIPDVFIRSRPVMPPPSGGNVAVADVEDAPRLIRVEPLTHRETFINIVDAEDHERVVTTLEILSPTNKAPRHPGREQYTRKQEDVLNSGTHLLEIDLLRTGEHTIAAPLAALLAEGVAWDYLICLHRAEPQDADETQFEVWFNRIRQRLPHVSVPLDRGVADITLDLQAVLDRCYDEADYGGRIDYAQEPVPPLKEDDALWTDALLRERGLRP